MMFYDQIWFERKAVATVTFYASKRRCDFDIDDIEAYVALSDLKAAALRAECDQKVRVGDIILEARFAMREIDDWHVTDWRDEMWFPPVSTEPQG